MYEQYGMVHQVTAETCICKGSSIKILKRRLNQHSPPFLLEVSIAGCMDSVMNVAKAEGGQAVQ